MLDYAKQIYQRHSKVLPVVFFIGGFLWDAFTLKRIDSWIDHLVLGAYLGGLSVSLWLMISKPRPKNRQLRSIVVFSPLLLQFFLGGLFSAYVVFFFKSASSLSSYLYLALLVAFLFGNEWLKYRSSRPSFLAAVYYLALFSYFCFALPVLFRRIDWWTFALSVVISGIIGAGFWHYLWVNRRIKQRQAKRAIASSNFTAVLVILLYIGNVIPPVPISMKVGGIFQSAEIIDGENRYKLQFEKSKIPLPWEHYNRKVSYTSGDTLYCFAAVFAPVKLEAGMLHRWQKKNDLTEVWETTDELPYKILGGRDEGFRGLTFKRNISPGKWRVDIVTENNRIVGRLPFELIEQAKDPQNNKTVFY